MLTLLTLPAGASQTNGVIAFYSLRDGDSELYSVKADGSDLRRLTHDPSEDVCPAWSPDGKQLAFSSDRSGNSEIYLLSTTGGQPVRLTDSALEKSQPDWSHDGLRIAFRGQSKEDSEIYVMKADGSDVTRLTDNAADEERPIWSPDGKQILFSFVSDNGSYDLWLMNADGADRRRLTDSPGTQEVFSDWAPDGKSIVYMANPEGARDFDLYRMTLNDNSIEEVVNTPFVDEDPQFSIDGRFIVFQSNRDGNYEIYVVGADGGNAIDISNHPAGDYWPTWKTVILGQSD